MTAKTTIPDFIQRDPEVILAECKEYLETKLGRELKPAQFEQLMLQFIVYREVLLENRFNAGMRQLILAFSTAPVLDCIAALVAVERLPASKAGCTLRFTLVEGHGIVTIPNGTRVSTTDGEVIFQTTDDKIIFPNTLTVEIKAIAVSEGIHANDYAIGTVNTILDPLAFVSKVGNIDVTGGGSNIETDDQLRERVRLAPSQYSTAGSEASYIFHAKSANALIKDVKLARPKPGTVAVIPLTDSEVTPQQVIDDIYAALSSEKVRPLTDTVVVQPPTAVPYSIAVDITLYENTEADTEKRIIETALENFVAGKRQTLGQDIVRAQITKACTIESVTYDVDVVSPGENIVIEDTEFGNCTGIEVNIIGFNRG